MDTTPAVTVSLPTDTALARRVFWIWLRRDCGGFVVAAIVVVIAAIAVAGSYPWLSGLYAGVALSFVGYLVRARRALLQRAEVLAGADLTLRLDEHGLTFTTPDSATRVRWTDITRVERLATMWAFRARRADSPFYVPAQALTPPAEAFLRGRLAAHDRQVAAGSLLAPRPARDSSVDTPPSTV